MIEPIAAVVAGADPDMAPKNADEDGFVKVSESDVKNLPFM